nr:MAG TPA: hypothetical protein [Caudoviricetes sp.]
MPQILKHSTLFLSAYSIVFLVPPGSPLYTAITLADLSTIHSLRIWKQVLL